MSSPGPARSQFPGKLHDLMTYAEREGLDHVISWVQDGRAIMVHKPEKLLEILPMFGFGQTKFRSFQRQLNMWRWERMAQGPYKGAWKHPYFIRGNKLLCSYMSRHRLYDPSIPTEVLSSSLSHSSLQQHRQDENTGFKITSPKFELNDRTTSHIWSLDSDVFEADDFAPLPFDAKTDLFQGKHLHFTDILDAMVGIGESKNSFLAESTPPVMKAGLSLLEPLPEDVFDSIF